MHSCTQEGSWCVLLPIRLPAETQVPKTKHLQVDNKPFPMHYTCLEGMGKETYMFSLTIAIVKMFFSRSFCTKSILCSTPVQRPSMSRRSSTKNFPYLGNSRNVRNRFSKCIKAYRIAPSKASRSVSGSIWRGLQQLI